MMMWTKSAINSLSSDSEHENVHQIRTPSARAAERDGSGLESASAKSSLPQLRDGTPEAIAYQLFLHIVEVEEMYLTLPPTKGKWPAHREWILSTYAQCIRVVRAGKTD